MPRAKDKQNQIYLSCLNNIRLGKWQTGFRFTERELTEAYSVSRTTVRKAIETLQNDGLVSMTRGWRNTFTVTGQRRFRFLWLSMYAPEKAPRPLRKLYGFVLKLAEANHAGFTYGIIQGDENDNWIREELREYDGIVISNLGIRRLMPELSALLRRHPNTVATQLMADNPAVITCATDDYQVGYMAAEYLFKKGFRHIAVMAISPGLYDMYFRERINGFFACCIDHAENLNDCRLLCSRNHSDFQNPECFLQKLKLSNSATEALFCITDNLALRLIEAMQKINLRVPRDISVIGCDDLPESRDGPVPLTTISHPTEKIAEYIWQKLTQNADCNIRPPPEKKLFQPVIIERTSVSESKFHR